MGPRCSHMNISAMSFIVVAKVEDIFDILLLIENIKPRDKLEMTWERKMEYRRGVLSGAIEYQPNSNNEIVYDYRGNKWRPFDPETAKKKALPSTAIGDSDEQEAVLEGEAVEESTEEIDDHKDSSDAADNTTARVHSIPDNASSSDDLFAGGFAVSPSRLAQILESRNFINSDIDLMLALFALIDKRGYKSLDIRDIFISFLVLVSKSVKECMLSALRMYDREETTVLDKDTMLHVLSLLNSVLAYFGDRSLLQPQVFDLVDSLFTMSGKVDGCISYVDFQDIMSQHPIVELMLSHQYQGPVRDKILDEEKIELLDIRL